MSDATQTTDKELLSKVSRRLKWILLTVMFIGFMDRQNLGFVVPYMKADLGITATQIGIGGSIFFVGYLLFEVPSNLMMARFGPRVWLARIMVSWGIVSCCGSLVIGAKSFYLFRLLLGLAEAGLIPGIMLYLSYWVPKQNLGRFASWALVIGPLSGSITALLTATLLSLNGFMNLSGWQWSFIIEGLPAVIFGVLLLRLLTDYPSKAEWLSPHERRRLTAIVGTANDQAPSLNGVHVLRTALRNPRIYLLGVLYFLLNVPLAATSWIPLSLHGHGLTAMQEGVLAAIPSAAATIAIIPWASRSDRRSERFWHLLLPALVAALGWGLAAFNSSNVTAITVFTAVGFAGTYAALGVFWALPSLMVSDETRAASLALTTAIGLPGSMLSLVGGGKWLETSHSFFGCYILAAVAMLAMCLVVVIGLRSRAAGCRTALLAKAPGAH